MGGLSFDRVKFCALSERELRRCSHRNLVLRGLWQLLDGERNARLQNEGGVFHSWLDQALLPVALGLARMPLSGIWFRVPSLPVLRWPSYRRILYRMAFARKNLERVYVLDATVADALRAEEWTRGKISYLPEPIDFTTGDAPTEIRNVVDCARREGRRIFAIIGALKPRKKGIEQVLDAIELLPEGICRLFLLVIAGSFESADFKEDCCKRVASLKDSHKGIHILILDRRLSDQEFIGVIDEADCILLTYNGNYRGSSGVLVQAAARGIPVIASNKDVVGRITSEKKLGRVVDPDDVAAVAEIIRTDILTPFVVDSRQHREFINPLRMNRFGEIIIRRAGDVAGEGSGRR